MTLGFSQRLQFPHHWAWPPQAVPVAFPLGTNHKPSSLCSSTVIKCWTFASCPVSSWECGGEEECPSIHCCDSQVPPLASHFQRPIQMATRGHIWTAHHVPTALRLLPGYDSKYVYVEACGGTGTLKFELSKDHRGVGGLTHNSPSPFIPENSLKLTVHTWHRCVILSDPRPSAQLCNNTTSVVPKL